MSPVDFVLATLVVMAGATLQGSIGFGLGMFSVPFLILIDARFIPAPLLLSSMALTVLLTHRNRHAIHFGDLKWALAGRLGGIALAAMTLALMPANGLELVFGSLVLLAVGMSASGLHLVPKPSVLLGAGTLSGFMGTTVSIGGPPMALVYQHQSGARIRGTLSAFFLVGVLLSLIGLSFVGRFGLQELLLAALLIPGILVGYLISRRTAGLLDRGYTRTGVLVVSAATGLAVILRQLI